MKMINKILAISNQSISLKSYNTVIEKDKLEPETTMEEEVDTRETITEAEEMEIEEEED